MSLTDEQAQALAQVHAVTNGQDVERERAILESVEWDVERAVQIIFDESDSQPIASSSNGLPTSRRIEQMEFEDSSPHLDPPTRPQPVYPVVAHLGLQLFSVLIYPLRLSFSIFTSILQHISRILHLPRFHTSVFSLRPPTSSRPPRPGNPHDAAERWVRALEDETGALSVTRAAATAANDTSGKVPEGSSLRHREKAEGRGRLLPDFWLGSYESALKAAQSDAKMLCVVLVSEEHDDTLEFKRGVLTDPDLVRVLTDNEFIVWGGDVRDNEAYQTALKLSATTYPFVAFVSLHPRSGPRSASSSTPQLSVISRHSGSPQTQTSAAVLHAYITTTLVPRVTPLLNRLRAEARTRQQERDLRAEQDRAFAEAERLDRERMLKRREEEARLQREAEEIQRKQLEERMREQWKNEWRRHARSTLPVEPGPECAGRLRIGMRLPDGQRLVRHFGPSDTLDVLYTFVDVQFVDRVSTDGGSTARPPADYNPGFDFTLTTAFPRVEVPFAKGTSLGSIGALKGGANLAVEMRAGSGKLSSSMDDEDSDEESG